MKPSNGMVPVAGADEGAADRSSSRVKRRRARRAGVLAGATLLLVVSSAMADLLGLPANGAQVNNDPAAGIDPSRSAMESDVVGGSLAGGARVPWAIFRQQTAGADQVFSRSFADGVWTTRGSGTVGGRSSASPTFGGSLNFDQGQDGEAPAIDFAGAADVTGAGRKVPWATWYENTTGTGFGQNNIFASRFDSTQNEWVFAGQSRGNGGSGPDVPSLNIHTDQSAENPSVAGGSAVDKNKPGPWVTWQETTTAPVSGKDQIFVERPIGPGSTTCDGVTPAGVPASGHVPAIGGFCWQQTGVPRVGPSVADPSLNVDPTRDGVEPDIAFTGRNAAGVPDVVPWVVWYEKDNTNHAISGLDHNNEMVFAAKGVNDGVSVNGGFHWVAVGNQGSATLDATGANHFGGCAASDAAEEGCSLNNNVNADAEDPRVAAGTLTPGNPTVPWVAWSEDTSHGVHGIFVSRLVGTHFVLFNGGAPISDPHHDASKPDITFFGNTPYVSWLETRGSNLRGFSGHFDPNGVFVVDTPDGVKLIAPPRARAHLLADVRAPISSACTADPFTNDGANCVIAAVNAPFFLFTTADRPQRLFGQAIVGGISCALFTGCTVRVTASGNGAVISSRLGQDDTVGILVERIVRFARVHGKQVPVLKLVGRVPLGKHHRGGVRIRWNLKVNGHKLGRGKYQIILRGFDRHLNLLGTTKPVIFTVR